MQRRITPSCRICHRTNKRTALHNVYLTTPLMYRVACKLCPECIDTYRQKTGFIIEARA